VTTARTIDKFQLFDGVAVDLANASSTSTSNGVYLKAVLNGIHVFLLNNNLSDVVSSGRLEMTAVMKYNRVVRTSDKLLIASSSYSRCQSCNWCCSTIGLSATGEEDIWYGKVSNFWRLDDNLVIVEMEYWYAYMYICPIHICMY
jgi:hypothetical protein